MTDIDTIADLEDWAGEALTDPRTGVPPDATVKAHPIGPRMTYPDTGNDEPTEPTVAWQGYELVIALRRDESLETILRLPWLLREAAKADQTLGGRVVGASVQLMPDDHDRIEPEAIDAHLVIRVPMAVFQARRPMTRS